MTQLGSGRELQAEDVEIGALGPGLCALASTSRVVVHMATLPGWSTCSRFEHQLPLGERIEAVAISQSFVALFVSPLRLLRLFSPAFIPIGVLAMPMDIVAMVASNQLLFCVFKARRRSAKLDVSLHFSLFDVERQEKLSSGRLPLSQQSTLRWIGFDGPQPLALDSAGILRAMVQNDQWVMSASTQSWVPVAELDGDCNL